MVDVVVAVGIVDGDGAADATAEVDQLGVEALERGAADAAVKVLDVGAVHPLEGALEVYMRKLGASYRFGIVVDSFVKDVVEDALELGQAAAAHVRDSAERVALAVDSQTGGALSGRSRQGDEAGKTHWELDFVCCNVCG